MEYTEDTNTEQNIPEPVNPGSDRQDQPEQDHPEKKKHPLAKGIAIGVLGTLAALTVTAGGLLYYGYRNLRKQYSQYAAENGQNSEGINLDAAKEKIGLLEYLVHNKFLFQEDIDAKKQEDYLYVGYVASLGDPYSRYYTAKEYVKLQEQNDGAYVGIGATVQKDPNTGNVEIVSLSPGGPAEKSGMLPGDILYKIDEEYVAGKDLDLLIMENVRGTEGSSLTVTVYRPSAKDYVTLSMTRERIVSETITASIRGDIGLIRLTQFEDVTPDQFKKAVDTLQEQGAKKLIIDLRNNPGGLLTAVLPCMDYMLPDGGPMLKFKGLGDDHEEFHANDGHEVSLPMAILVNEYTASAAEAFSGAMQDYGKAVLVGTQTFGKGIVQSTIPLGDGSAVTLTTQRYFTPKDQDIHMHGLTPDVECALAEGLNAGIQIPEDQDNQLQKAIEIVNRKAEEEAS